MAYILHIVQIVSALLMIALILLQRTSGDLGASSGDSGSFAQTRRGSERFFFMLTIIVALVFAAASLAVIVTARG